MVKLPDIASLTGSKQEVGEAVKLPSDSPAQSGSSAAASNGVSDAERAKIEAEAIKKYEADLKAKEDAEKARKYAEIEAKEKAEQERLLAEKQRQEELAREQQKKEKERQEWEREEALKKAEEEKKRAEIEKELIAKQKQEAKEKAAAEKAAKKNQSHTLRNAGIIVIILIAILAAAYISLISGVETFDGYGYPLSFQANYEVFVPDNTNCQFFGMPINALSSGGSVTLMVNNERKTLAIGEQGVFTTKHMTVKVFGIEIYSTDYQLTAEYEGVITNKDAFKFNLKTSSSIPSLLINPLSKNVEYRTI